MRNGQYRILGDEGVEVSYKLLTPDVSGAIEFCRMDVPPNSDTTDVPREHIGEETAYVISGQIDIYVDGNLYHLNEGDGIRIPPRSKHRWVNNSNEMAYVIFAVTPPSF